MLKIAVKRASLLRAAAGGALLLLSGCGGDGLSRSFGLTRATPDEFTVTTLPPLSIPPDWSLRAPQPGQARPTASPAQSAAATLAPATVLAAPTPGSDSAGQDALVQAAGPAAPADIRARVAAEGDGGAQDPSLTDRLTSWAKPPQGAALVDPQKEAERLRANAALGRAPDAGDTPVIRPKSSGILDWFN